MRGRTCARGMNALLHHNRDDTIGRQEKEIQTLKRKLEEMTRDKNDMSAHNKEMSTRLMHTRLTMRESFDDVRDYMLEASQAEGWARLHESAHWRDTYNSLQDIFNIVTNEGEDDSEREESDEE